MLNVIGKLLNARSLSDGKGAYDIDRTKQNLRRVYQ